MLHKPVKSCAFDSGRVKGFVRALVHSSSTILPSAESSLSTPVSRTTVLAFRSKGAIRRARGGAANARLAVDKPSEEAEVYAPTANWPKGSDWESSPRLSGVAAAVRALAPSNSIVFVPRPYPVKAGSALSGCRPSTDCL